MPKIAEEKTVTRCSLDQLPAVAAICEMCGATPALPDLMHPDFNLCADCQRRHLLDDAAIRHVKQLLVPTLTMWAQHWVKVGLKPAELSDALHCLTQEYNRDQTVRLFVRQLLSTEVPEYEETPPVRVVVRTTELSTVVGVRSDKTGASFVLQDVAGRRRDHHIPAGCDAVLILQVDGSALLLFTGIGVIEEQTVRKESVLVPERLVPAVNALLEEFHHLPFNILPKTDG